MPVMTMGDGTNAAGAKAVRGALGKPMTIGLLSDGGAAWIGGLEYFRNLALAVRAAEAGSGTMTPIVVIGDATDPMTTKLLGSLPGVRLATLEPEDRSLVKRLRTRAGFPAADRRLERLCAAESIDFLYPYDGRYGELSCRSLGWIPDFQHHHLPEYFSKAELESRSQRYRQMADQCPGIVFSSRAALADFQLHYPGGTAATHVMPFRISLDPAWLISDPWETVRKFHLPRRYALVCNQFWQHKNHPRLLEAVALAVRQSADFCIVLTGRLNDYRRPTFADEVVASIQTLGIHSHVRVLGMIAKHDQVQLLRSAQMMVQPSLFEGWNTGVEEGRALGKRMLMSNIDVHVEQNPPDGRLFDARSADDMARVLVEEWNRPVQEWSFEKEQKAVIEYQRLVVEYGRSVLRLAHGEDQRQERSEKRSTQMTA
jgi:glycosyltransferase involved in cell wall biosynthesis